MSTAMERALAEAEKHGALYVEALRHGQEAAESDGYDIVGWENYKDGLSGGGLCCPVGAALIAVDSGLVKSDGLQFPDHHSVIGNDLGTIVELLGGSEESWGKIISAVDGGDP